MVSRPHFRLNTDGSATVSLPPGYLGSCALCSAEATHAEWCPFDPPIPAVRVGALTLPECRGIWHHVCDAHCDPLARHKEAP